MISKNKKIWIILLLFINTILLSILLFWEWNTSSFSRFAKEAMLRGEKEESKRYCFDAQTTSAEGETPRLLLYDNFGTKLFTWQPLFKRLKEEISLEGYYLPLFCQPILHKEYLMPPVPSRMYFNDQYFDLLPDDETNFSIDQNGSIALTLSNLHDLYIPSHSLTFLLKNRQVLPNDLRKKLRYRLQMEWKDNNREHAYRNKPLCYRELEQNYCLWGNQYSTDKDSSIDDFDDDTIHVFLNHQYKVKAIAQKGKIYIDHMNNIFIFADYTGTPADLAFYSIRKWLSLRFDEEMQDEDDFLIVSHLSMKMINQDSLSVMIDYANTGQLPNYADRVLNDEDKKYISRTANKDYNLIETNTSNVAAGNLYEQCGLQVYPIDFTTRIIPHSAWRDHLSWTPESLSIDSIVDMDAPTVKVHLNSNEYISPDFEYGYGSVIVVLDVNYPVNWLIEQDGESDMTRIASVILTGNGPQGFATELPIIGNVTTLYKHPTCGDLALTQKSDPLRKSLYKWLHLYGAKNSRWQY